MQEIDHWQQKIQELCVRGGYRASAVEGWLRWLEWAMQQRQRPLFFVHDIQPDLLTVGQRIWFILLVIGFAASGGSLVGALGGALIEMLVFIPFDGVMMGAFVGGIAGWSTALAVRRPAEMVSPLLSDTLRWMVTHPFVWVVGVHLSWQKGIRGIIDGLRYGPALGVCAGLIAGLLLGILTAIDGRLSTAVGVGLDHRWEFGIGAGMMLGMIWGLGGGTFGSIAIGLRHVAQAIHRREMQPGDVWRSAGSACIGLGVGSIVWSLFAQVVWAWGAFLVWGIVVWLGFGVFVDLPGMVGRMTGGVLLVALAGGVMTALDMGGRVGIRWLAFWLVLWIVGALPWRIHRFLDDAVGVGLLRCEGDGYMFMDDHSPNVPVAHPHGGEQRHW